MRAGGGLDALGRARLGAFLSLLRRFERVTDLRGPGRVGREEEEVASALLGEPFLEGVEGVVDVGSGNGFPIVPLLIAQPGLRAVLLEPRERRWAFLCEVVRELGLAAEVRREGVEAHRGGPYGALTCRGVGVGVWGSRVELLVRPGGLVLWWTGEGVGAVPWGAPVLPSPVATPGGGHLHVWRRRFT